MDATPALAPPRERKTARLLLTFTPSELERLIAWSRAQEREPEQQIRYVLHDVLQGAQPLIHL
jgi:hypothetical protein